MKAILPVLCGIILLLSSVVFGQTSTLSAPAVKGKTVLICWSHAADPAEYTYTIRYLYYQNGAVVVKKNAVDGRLFDAVCDWCARFGSKTVSISVVPQRKSDKVSGARSNTVQFKLTCY